MKCGKGCCPANYSQCCDNAIESVDSSTCNPATFTCCPLDVGGGSCPPDLPQCCPPSPFFPYGSCAAADEHCCGDDVCGADDFCCLATAIFASHCCSAEADCCISDDDCANPASCFFGCCAIVCGDDTCDAGQFCCPATDNFDTQHCCPAEADCCDVDEDCPDSGQCAFGCCYYQGGLEPASRTGRSGKDKREAGVSRFYKKAT